VCGNDSIVSTKKVDSLEKPLSWMRKTQDKFDIGINVRTGQTLGSYTSTSVESLRLGAANFSVHSGKLYVVDSLSP
jgi:hypothetical protein